MAGSPESGVVPKRRQREGEDLIAELHGRRAEVQDEPGDEPVAQAIPQPAEVAARVGAGRSAGFDLDPDSSMGRSEGPFMIRKLTTALAELQRVLSSNAEVDRLATLTAG